MTASRRVALLPSEPLRPKMAGIGIRYLELARRLPEEGLEVVLVNPGDPSEVPDLDTGGRHSVEVRTFERGRLGEILADCDVAVSQAMIPAIVRTQVSSLLLALAGALLVLLVLYRREFLSKAHRALRR